MKSLRRTGFTGDIVFAVSILDIGGRGVKEFLTASEHVVTYVLELSCFNAENEVSTSAKGGMRVCQLHHLYADAQGIPQNDPRDARTIATTRYELYWLWSHAWIMLIDARDSYFQTNPFDTVPRDTDPNKKSGVLHFFGVSFGPPVRCVCNGFGSSNSPDNPPMLALVDFTLVQENANATRIGQSVQNRKWLTRAYGDAVAAALENKPTICSGSTMGEQVAMETYLRSMVCESDETGTKLMGADQGFHNFLYYSKKLGNAESIRGITVFDQGRGAINNLGAMRKAPLESWGNGKILEFNSDTDMTVLNWDGSISPVVHQFDRHPILSKYMYKYQTGLFRAAFWAELKGPKKG